MMNSFQKSYKSSENAKLYDIQDKKIVQMSYKSWKLYDKQHKKED